MPPSARAARLLGAPARECYFGLIGNTTPPPESTVALPNWYPLHESADESNPVKWPGSPSATESRVMSVVPAEEAQV
ncbi:hypothetical protein N7535_007756 [Penicillium sp. DV-2018c]|nr:hypothetical protein N7461_003790 [Penicillium sp. DV-2018c]KAJ5566118.1 hypothetical protein N7535_007756 [Penicillium sp. DV-2018c]